MSSPDHSTSNNKDAFSSNIPDYVSTIPDYSPAFSGKTYSNALNNSIGNDLKTYIRRFQKLALLCPNMVPNSVKLIEVFIEGLPRIIEGNVTTSKPQSLEEVITITQRLMEQNKRQEAIRAYAVNPAKDSWMICNHLIEMKLDAPSF
nr:reverse transcriptase domain-containing protein [Tanacetum cinerariifolium]